MIRTSGFHLGLKVWGGRFTHAAKCLATPTFVDHTLYYIVHHSRSSYILHIIDCTNVLYKFTPAPPPHYRWNPIHVYRNMNIIIIIQSDKWSSMNKHIIIRASWHYDFHFLHTDRNVSRQPIGPDSSGGFAPRTFLPSPALNRWVGELSFTFVQSCMLNWANSFIRVLGIAYKIIIIIIHVAACVLYVLALYIIIASNPGRLKYGLVSIAWVINNKLCVVHPRPCTIYIVWPVVKLS